MNVDYVLDYESWYLKLNEFNNNQSSYGILDRGHLLKELLKEFAKINAYMDVDKLFMNKYKNKSRAQKETLDRIYKEIDEIFLKYGLSCNSDFDIEIRTIQISNIK